VGFSIGGIVILSGGLCFGGLCCVGECIGCVSMLGLRWWCNDWVFFCGWVIVIGV